jgi:nicotinamidase-related amidase
LVIDHQPFQFAGVRSHDTQTIINNVVALAKTAKIFNVPTLLSTVIEERGGLLLKPLQEVFPDQKPINRTFINSWEDDRVVDWVKQTGKKKIVIAALWTEVCLALAAIQALGEGYEVYIVTDASGGVSVEHTKWLFSGWFKRALFPLPGRSLGRSFSAIGRELGPSLNMLNCYLIIWAMSAPA